MNTLKCILLSKFLLEYCSYVESSGLNSFVKLVSILFPSFFPNLYLKLLPKFGLFACLLCL